MLLIIFLITIGIIGGICFSIGLIPGTNPYHKKKLLNGFKALKCNDLLLSPIEYNIKILHKMKLLSDDDVKKINNPKLSINDKKKIGKKNRNYRIRF